jgi:hypothetical protein
VLTTAAEKRGVIAVAAAALILMGSVHSSNTSWNVNARMALVFAFVERGTFAIDGYDGEHDAFPTMDKAAYNGHHYSDKAIGVSLLGVPVYAAIRAVTAVTGIEWHLQLKIYAIRLLTTSIPAAIALAMLWLMMVREAMPPERAFLAVAAVFCGSWWFGYSTLAMPYAHGIAATLGAVLLTLYPRGGRIAARAAAGIGFLCGLTVIFDLTFALMVLPVMVIFLMTVRAYPRPQAMRLAAVAAAAGVVPLAIYFAYIYAIFERLTIPYYYIVVPLFREGTQQGFLGIGWPQPGAAWFLTVHPYRGVFFWAPWMILALIGCVMATRRTGTARLWGWMGLWGFASYLALASGYYMWWGGWSMGARLMSPMLASVPMGLAELLRRDRSKGWWWTFVAASVVSIALCLPVSIINPQVEEGNTYERLRWAQIGDSLDVPQFRYLKMVYSGEWFGDQIPVPLFMRVLPFAAFVAAGGILLAAAKRSRSPAPLSDASG